MTTAPGAKAGSFDLEPVALGARVAEQHQLAADRVDGEVDLPVVVEVGRREAATVDLGHGVEPDHLARGGELSRMIVRGEVLEGLERFRALVEADDGDGAVCDHQVEIGVVVEIDPRRTPAREARVERRRDVGPGVGEHRPAVDGGALR